MVIKFSTQKPQEYTPTPDTDTVGLWHGNNLLDYSGNGNSLTLYGNAAANVSGHPYGYGGSLSFDGTGDYNNTLRVSANLDGGSIAGTPDVNGGVWRVSGMGAVSLPGVSSLDEDTRTEPIDDVLSAVHGLNSWEGGVLAGASQITIVVKDDSDAPVPGAFISVYDSSNTTLLTRVITDNSGQAILAIDDGDYKIRLFRSGYAFTVPEDLTVSGDGSVEYVGTALYIPSTPSAPDLCVIFGTVRDAAGVPISGACVEVYAVTPQTVSGIQKGERIATTVTDADGWFEIELVRNTVVQFAIEGTAFDFERTVPDQASQDVTTWTE